MLEEIEAKAAERGDERLRIQTLGASARIEWFAGDLQQALDLATEAHERHDRQHDVGHPVRLKALAEADLGDVEQARARRNEGLMTAREDVGQWAILSAGVLGRLELALGDLEAAWATCASCPESSSRTGTRIRRPLFGETRSRSSSPLASSSRRGPISRSTR